MKIQQTGEQTGEELGGQMWSPYKEFFLLLHNKTLKLQELYLVLCFLLGNFSASGVYMPTFRNTLFHFQRQVDVSSFSFLVHSTHIYLPMKMGQSVMKRRHINSRRWVITQKKAYNIQNTAKA